MRHLMMLSLMCAACGSVEPPEEPPPPAPLGPTAAESALTRADALASAAARNLRTRMVQEMGANGPGAALEACSIEAEALTAAPIPPASGARVGRSSLRLRSGENEAPAWVQTWLEAQGDSAQFAQVEGFRRVDGVGDARVARVLQPIPMLPNCLKCHGSKDEITADVRAKLDARYPDDAAHGYHAGDLRGALWAEVPVR